MTKYLGTGAINRFFYFCASSFEYCCKATKGLSEKYSNGGFVCFACWLWYLIEVVIYFFHIFWDLLTGHPLWTPIPSLENIGGKCEPIRVYNPTPAHNTCTRTRNNSVVLDIISKPKTVKTPQVIEKVQVQESTIDEVDVKLFIQGLLKANRNTLKGVVLSTKERKIPEDELLQFTTLGKLSSPAMKQYISFGTEINDKLHKLMGTLPTCAYVKRKQGTCFVLDNGDYTPIVDKLNEIFNINSVRINLTGC